VKALVLFAVSGISGDVLAQVVNCDQPCSVFADLG
jgi:hypothetical protein